MLLCITYSNKKDICCYLGVTHKVMTDLRSCSPETVDSIVRVDEDCAQFGIGAVYGQITVIGCKVQCTKSNKKV